MATPRRRQPEWRVIAPGVERQMISEVGGTQFSVYRLAGGQRFEYHAHPYPEMGVIVAGGGTHRMQLEVGRGGARRQQVVEVRIRRGDCFYIPPNVPHAVETSPGRTTVCVDLIMDGASGDVAPRTPKADLAAARRRFRPVRPKRASR